MEYYVSILLVVSLMVVLTTRIWVITRSYMFLFGALSLYFWSIHGAWAIVFDKRGGDSGLAYGYIEGKLFTIFLDQNYLATILIYGLFCVVVLTTVLAVIESMRYMSVPRRTSVRTSLPGIDHRVVFIVTIVLAAASYIPIKDVFSQAILLGQTGYAAVRSDTIPFFTVYKILSRAALSLAFIGLAIMSCKDDAKYFSANFKPAYLAIYLLLIGFLIAYMVLLGNKNALFGAFIAALLIYLAHSSSPRLKSLFVIGTLVFLTIGSIDYLRGFALLSGEAGNLSIDKLLISALRIVLSNEAFGAHFSMYGVLRFNVEPTYGLGLYSLACSIIPRYFWPSRPEGIYEYYADAVGAAPDQGFTVHHAAGWYLEFGLLGVVVGATLLGYLWARLYIGFQRVDIRSGHLKYVFWTVFPFTFSSYFPNILRNGVDVYKGIAIDALIVPVLLISIVTTNWVTSIIGVQTIRSARP